MQEIGPGFSLFHYESLLARFTAGIQGTHHHKSRFSPTHYAVYFFIDCNSVYVSNMLSFIYINFRFFSFQGKYQIMISCVVMEVRQGSFAMNSFALMTKIIISLIDNLLSMLKTDKK